MFFSGVERDESPNHRKHLEASKIQHVHWRADYAIYSEHEKLRMKVTENELARIISFLNLRSEEMPIEKYVQLAR